MRTVRLGEDVARAIEDGRPIVALESTVFSNLGLPTPHNATALRQSIIAIETLGAVPAVTAVIEGRPCAGITAEEHELILTADQKTAERDLPVAVGQQWAVGVTTVSASLAIAERAGISVFATGGIGGVHRDASATGDVSADLGAIARHPVATVSAGAKSFLDLPRTLERLEMLGVPVVGWQTDTFPAFTATTSGLPIPRRCDDIEELAAIVASQRDFGRGILVVTPVPDAAALEQAIHDAALADALAAVAEQQIVGAAVTPFVLDRIARATGGESVPANLALVENNAKLAARLAVELAK